jgi:hypothetical protein
MTLEGSDCRLPCETPGETVADANRGRREVDVETRRLQRHHKTEIGKVDVYHKLALNRWSTYLQHEVRKLSNSLDS